jgi:hypothetical protein
MGLIMGAFIPSMFGIEIIPSCDSVELMAKPPVLEKSYIVKKSFQVPHFNTYVDLEDTIYKNIGDNNFYLKKKMTGMTYHCEVEYSLAMKAVRYGWIELVKVEDAE